MRTLVTGGTGFVGSHLVDRLLAKGHEVRTMVRPSSNLQWLSDPRIELFFSSLTDPEKLKNAVRDVDVVYHVAGSLIERNWSGFIESNVKPVRLLLDACRKAAPQLKRFVLVSSTGAMGPSPDGRPLTEMDAMHPVSDYGRSKLEGEKVARAYFDMLPLTIVRPSAVYGPRDPNFVRLFKQVRSGVTPLLGREDPYFNLIHAEDLAEGIISASVRQESIGQTFVLASVRPYSRSEIMGTISDVVGRRPLRIFLPLKPSIRIASLYAKFRIEVLNKPTLLDPDRLNTIAQRYWTFDVSKSVEMLEFKEAWSLLEGLRQTYAWYVQQEWMDRDQGR